MPRKRQLAGACLPVQRGTGAVVLVLLAALSAGIAQPASRVIDVFMFNGDAIVSHRLAVMAMFVDKFFVVESRYTHAGARKDVLFIDQQRSVFEPYMHKVDFVVVEAIPDVPSDYYDVAARSWMRSGVDVWWRENFQRWAAHDAYVASRASADSRDVVIIADADEIVAPHTLRWIRTNYNAVSAAGGVVHLELPLFICGPKWRKPEVSLSTMVLTGDVFAADTAVTLQLRRTQDTDGKRIVVLPRAGWHLSYFMSVDDIVRKFDSFTHQEHNSPAMKDRERIRRCIEDGIDFYTGQMPRSGYDTIEQLLQSEMDAAAEYQGRLISWGGVGASFEL